MIQYKRGTVFFSLLFAGVVLLGCGQVDGNEKDNLSPEAFYRGHTVTIIVGSTPGGGYDTAARLLARYIGKYIPGRPEIIVQNMPGGASLMAANHVYNVAPKDGSVIGVSFDTFPLAPLWEFPGAQFDPLKIAWIGALVDRDRSVVIMRTDSPVTSFAEAKEKVATLGSSGEGSPSSAYTRLLNELLGTKFKVITGYPGNREVLLALERGEVDGRAAANWDYLERVHPDWIKQGLVVPIVQLGTSPIPGYPDLPRAIDLAKNENDRKIMRVAFGIQQFGRIFFTSREVPPERLAALRVAFQDTLKDSDFIAEAKIILDTRLNPSTPEEIDAYLHEAYSLTPELRDRTARYIGND